MFTGIIRYIGTIENVHKLSDGSVELTISALFASDLHEGDSVAVDGVCLTVLSHTNTTWTCRLMAETIAKTTLGSLSRGSLVHLELPTKAGEGLHGHIVQGHVDAVCTITNISPAGDDRVIRFQPPKEYMDRIHSKGSIALGGVSLTIVDVTKDTFTVSFMPYTLQHTTFGTTRVGDTVNMETDHSQDAAWISGIVTRGQRRGTALGFPTANIVLDKSSISPHEGIYAVRAMIADDPTMYAGALHVGPRPTFTDAAVSVELHLISFPPSDLYDLPIRFRVIGRIRDVVKFESAEALVAAIRQDVATATSILMYH